MRQFFVAGVALGSVVFGTGMTSLVNAKTSQSNTQLQPQSTISPTYIVQATTNSLASIEQAVHAQINQYRASKGLAPLTLDERISQQARTHSQNMGSGAVAFSHDGFTGRVQAIAKVIPYRGAAENVAYNKGYGDPAKQAFQGWLNSTGHRQNIEGNYNLTGIGVVKNAKGEYYFTQIFIRGR